MTINTETKCANKAGAHIARASAFVSAIQSICIRLEDACGDARETFDLTTAIEACAQLAAQELEAADALTA